MTAAAKSRPHALDDAECLDRLRLLRSENVGPVTYRQLLTRYGAAAEALDALPDLAKRGGRSRLISVPSRADAEREWEETEAAGGSLLFEGQPGFPVLLAAAEGSPPILSVRGHSHILDRRGIGIVGARNASAVGSRFARTIAHDLGEAGLVVVSGLARGIDGAAHTGALATGTIAVVAGGIDIVYPPEHERLQAEIAERGLIVSEMPVGTRPQGRHFPRRNRIISGLSLGVLVVEAAPKSGSLITARFALEQNREVFAVPGSPLDPRCQGTNNLIRQGAVLTETADDILSVLADVAPPLAEPGETMAGRAPAPNVDEQELVAARDIVRSKLGPTPVEVDELIRQCDLTPAILMTILLELELAGILARQPGNRVSLI
ncbi:MAG TPA: DNA-processing protein DprA [Alphaproteobacteria bacterium]|nr:DNA-processing protein DprA [Alphaproteobacteria bacterium]